MKKFYYVQVISNNKIQFITSIDNLSKSAKWENDKQFKVFSSKTYATDIATGLALNGYYAFVVESLYELTFKNNDLK